jgi:hypothetical protein
MRTASVARPLVPAGSRYPSRWPRARPPGPDRPQAVTPAGPRRRHGPMRPQRRRHERSLVTPVAPSSRCVDPPRSARQVPSACCLRAGGQVLSVDCAGPVGPAMKTLVTDREGRSTKRPPDAFRSTRKAPTAVSDRMRSRARDYTLRGPGQPVDLPPTARRYALDMLACSSFAGCSPLSQPAWILPTDETEMETRWTVPRNVCQVERSTRPWPTRSASWWRISPGGGRRGRGPLSSRI